MFLSKAGLTGKALCAAYKEEASVRVFLDRLKNGEYKTTYYFNKDEETLVYEAFTDKGQYIYLEVSGDGKPVEHVDRYTTIPGLDDEQKALYVYLFENENRLAEEDKDSLDEIYKPVSSQIKPIMPLSGAQIGKRAKIRRDFLKYIESETVETPKENEYVPTGKFHIGVSLFSTINDDKFDFELSLIDEDNNVLRIDNNRNFVYAFVNEEPLKLKKQQVRITPESLDSTSLEVARFFADANSLTTGYSPFLLSISQMAKLLSMLKGQYVYFGNDKYYVDSEVHMAGYKILPNEELEFVPSLLTARTFRRHSNSEYVILLDQQTNVVEIYKFANSSMGKVFNFFLENEDVDYRAIKDIIFEKIPLDRSLNALAPKDENNLRIALYVDMNDEGHITFKTIYTIFGEYKERSEFDGNYYYQTIIQNYEKELEKVGGLENGLIKEQNQILSFLQQDLTSLKKVADVMLSDQLSNAKVRRPESISVSVKNNIDWLSLSIKSPEFDAKQIAAILDAYRKKKKFVLLKGDYILLKDEDLETVLEVKESTKMNDKLEVETKPIYEAFKLMALQDKGVKVDFSDFVKDVVEDIACFKDKQVSLTKEVKRVVRPYQEDGIKWLSVLHKYRLGGILADDMGLGKTLETIAFIASTKEQMPSLVIAPKSVIYNWLSEFKRWAPEFAAYVIDGTRDERIFTIGGIKNDEKAVYITSYDSMRNDIALYKNKKFNVIITDEAQYIKNGAAMKSQAVRELNAVSRFALTGTPIENSMADLWAIFDFLMPGYLDSFNLFKQRYILAGDQTLARSSLSRKITPFLLRRTKNEVLRDLPKKTTQLITITMNDEARTYYDACLADVRLKIKQKKEEITKGDRHSGKALFSVLPLLTKLREVCVDPGVFLDGFEEESAKMAYALSYVMVSLQEGHKVLVFSSFTKVLDHMFSLLKEANTNSYYIYGATDATDRLEMANDFNTKDDVNVMLVSLKAGGTGLNLHGADVVIHLDPWWNVAAEEQATDRAYRIGQKRPVSVVKLVCHNSIEEKVIQLQDSKRELYNEVIKSGDEAISKLNFDDIQFLLG